MSVPGHTSSTWAGLDVGWIGWAGLDWYRFPHKVLLKGGHSELLPLKQDLLDVGVGRYLGGRGKNAGAFQG